MSIHFVDLFPTNSLQSVCKRVPRLRNCTDFHDQLHQTTSILWCTLHVIILNLWCISYLVYNVFSWFPCLPCEKWRLIIPSVNDPDWMSDTLFIVIRWICPTYLFRSIRWIKSENKKYVYHLLIFLMTSMSSYRYEIKEIFVENTRTTRHFENAYLKSWCVWWNFSYLPAQIVLSIFE